MADERSLGDIIRRQRELNALSMRQFAQMVGISNPYLSQIERGLRDPSLKVVEGRQRQALIQVNEAFAGKPAARRRRRPEGS